MFNFSRSKRRRRLARAINRNVRHPTAHSSLNDHTGDIDLMHVHDEEMDKKPIVKNWAPGAGQSAQNARRMPRLMQLNARTSEVLPIRLPDKKKRLFKSFSGKVGSFNGPATVVRWKFIEWTLAHNSIIYWMGSHRKYQPRAPYNAPAVDFPWEVWTPA